MFDRKYYIAPTTEPLATAKTDSQRITNSLVIINHYAQLPIFDGVISSTVDKQYATRSLSSFKVFASTKYFLLTTKF